MFKSQHAFVERRHILDVVLIASKVVDSILHVEYNVFIDIIFPC